MAGSLQACTELEHLVPAPQELTAGLLVVPLEPSPALGQPLLPGLQLLLQGCPHPHQRPEMGQHGRDVLELGGGKGTRGYGSTHPTVVLLTLILGVISCSRSPHRCPNVELGVLVAQEEHNPGGHGMGTRLLSHSPAPWRPPHPAGTPRRPGGPAAAVAAAPCASAAPPAPAAGRQHRLPAVPPVPAPSWPPKPVGSGDGGSGDAATSGHGAEPGGARTSRKASKLRATSRSCSARWPSRCRRRCRSSILRRNP